MSVVRGPGRRGRPTRAEEIEAGVRCECGVHLDRHPPLDKPRDWSFGRPCAKTSLDRGRGWDGRALAAGTVHGGTRSPRLPGAEA